MPEISRNTIIIIGLIWGSVAVACGIAGAKCADGFFWAAVLSLALIGWC